MSECKSRPPTDNSQKESDETESPCQVFQFINLSNNDPGSQKKNLTKARSHVTKVFHRRRQTEEKQRKLVVRSRTELATIFKGLHSQTLFTNLDQGFLICGSSPWSHIEADIIPTLISQRRWSPLAHQMVHHMVTAVIATLFPTDSADKPSDAAFEAWHAIRSSRMVIHAIICGAAAHRDSQRLTIEQSKSREVFAHRGEALRLISNELSNLREGDEPSEALIFSVLAMTAEPIDDSPQAMDIDNGTVQPFHLSHMQQGWERSFLRVRYSQVHHHGLFGLVARCGGLTALQNRALAQMISNHDVLMAAQELRPPRQPFAQVDEIASLVSDPSLNVPELEPHEGRAPGCSLPTLQRSLGTSSLLASVLTGLQRIVAVDEALARGTLRNTNVLALGGEKQALHHAILSVPPLPSTADRSLHEPVRLVTLIFDVGILFPLPPATGALARLVRWMKAALEDIEMKPVRNGWTEALIWIHFVGGVAAKGMAERVWFVERLSGLMDWQGMTSWAEVKQLLRSFVWMADAMNEEAISLWDEAHCHGGT